MPYKQLSYPTVKEIQKKLKTADSITTKQIREKLRTVDGVTTKQIREKLKLLDISPEHKI